MNYLLPLRKTKTISLGRKEVKTPVKNLLNAIQ